MYRLRLVFPVLFVLGYCFQSSYSVAQNPNPTAEDSLLRLINLQGIEDTIKMDAYYHLAGLVVYRNPDSAEILVGYGMEISEKINDLDGMGQAYGWMGYLKAEKGDISGALAYNLKSLAVAQKLNLKAEYPIILNNLANLHVDLDNDEQALQYFLECVTINKELGNEKSLATNYNNIGSFYRQAGNFERALEYFRKSLSIRTKIDDKYGQSYTYSNMGTVFERMDEIDTALYYYQKGLKIRRDLNLHRGTAASLFKIAKIYLIKNQLNLAEEFAKESNEIAKTWEYTYENKESAKVLYAIYKAKNKLGQALFYHEIYTELHDSINSIENQRALIRSKYQFEYNQKHILDSLEKDKIIIENQLLDKENKVKAGRISVQRLWLTIAVLSIVMLIILLLAIRKNSAVRMENLRAEVKLRLNETLKLKSQLEETKSIQSPFENLNLVLQDKLTSREEEILDALVLGLSNKEIAEKLFLSVNTIKTHILSLYTKLDVNNRTQAAVKGSLLRIQKNE